MTWADVLLVAVVFGVLIALAHRWWRGRRGLSVKEVALAEAAALLLRVWLAVRQHDRGEISGEELVWRIKSRARIPEATEALAILMVESGMAQLTVPTAAAAEDLRAGRIEAADFMAVVERMFELRE